MTDESWDYTLTVKVGHDHFGRPLLSCDTWPPTQAEAGVIRQMRDMLSSWLDNKGTQVPGRHTARDNGK